MTAGTSEERLVSAALELVAERGWAGVTTRELARRAGVNEVTLFRRFGSKQQLLVTAVKTALAGFEAGIPEPSGDVAADFATLAAGYLRSAEAYPLLVARLLPELRFDGKARELVGPMQEALSHRLLGLVAEYQERGELVREPPADAVRAFIGPLLARALLAHVLPTAGVDVRHHVELFLHGRLRS